MLDVEVLHTCTLDISTSPFHSSAWDMTPGRSTAKEKLEPLTHKIILVEKKDF